MINLFGDSCSYVNIWKFIHLSFSAAEVMCKCVERAKYMIAVYSSRVCNFVGTDAGSVQQDQSSIDDNSSSNMSSSEPAAKKKKVKRVSWVDESKLCSYFYFQMDETERGQFVMLTCFVILVIVWQVTLHQVSLTQWFIEEGC